MATRRRSTPRRARYTVTVSPSGSQRVEKKLILAYDPADARKFYEARGWIVRNVVKGDLLNCADQGGWRVNMLALRETTQELGLRWPVLIKQTSKSGPQAGCHRIRFIDGRTTHVITMKSYLSPEKASRYLRHELRHAYQCEKAAGRDLQASRDLSGVGVFSHSAINLAWNEYCATFKGLYKRSPLEHDANHYQDLPGPTLARAGR